MKENHVLFIKTIVLQTIKIYLCIYVFFSEINDKIKDIIICHYFAKKIDSIHG